MDPRVWWWRSFILLFHQLLAKSSHGQLSSLKDPVVGPLPRGWSDHHVTSILGSHSSKDTWWWWFYICFFFSLYLLYNLQLGFKCSNVPIFRGIFRDFQYWDPLPILFPYHWDPLTSTFGTGSHLSESHVQCLQPPPMHQWRCMAHPWRRSWDFKGEQWRK